MDPAVHALPIHGHAPALRVARHDPQAVEPGGQVLRDVVLAAQYHGQAAAHRIAGRATDRGRRRVQDLPPCTLHGVEGAADACPS